MVRVLKQHCCGILSEVRDGYNLRPDGEGTETQTAAGWLYRPGSVAVTTYDPMVRVLKLDRTKAPALHERDVVTTYDPMVRVLKPRESTLQSDANALGYNLRPDGEGTETPTTAGRWPPVSALQPTTRW